MTNLKFSTLRAANTARLPEFRNALGGKAHSKDDGSDWSLSAWVNACSGEAGELGDVLMRYVMMQRSLGMVANLAKKMERGDFDTSLPDVRDDLKEDLSDELADVVTYLDLLANQFGIDLGQAVLNKFNRVSMRVGATTRISACGSGHYSIKEGAKEGFAKTLSTELCEAIDDYRDTKRANAPFYTSWNGSAMFVKDGDFFRDQGGLREEWGKAWEPVYNATTLEEARGVALAKRGVAVAAVRLNTD